MDQSLGLINLGRAFKIMTENKKGFTDLSKNIDVKIINIKHTFLNCITIFLYDYFFFMFFLRLYSNMNPFS